MKKLSILLFSLFCLTTLFGQNMWQDIPLSRIDSQKKERVSHPSEYRTLSFDALSFLEATRDVAGRATLNDRNNVMVNFPLPDGRNERFKLVDSELMHPTLAAKFPALKTYMGIGISDPTASIRVTYSPHFGLSVMILSGKHSTVYIDPLTTDNVHYMSYYRNDIADTPVNFTCYTDESIVGPSSELTPSMRVDALGDCNLRRYLLAQSCTGEYAQYHITQAGGTTGTTAGDKAIVQSAMNVTMNRVNGVYERDLGITMQFVADNDMVIYLDGGTDPWTNEYNTTTAQTLDAVIGVNNYDIGHNFNTTGGGSAGCIDCVCLSNNQNGTHKGRGYTGRAAPIGDPFDIDYVAHEMGHQFGGFHTQSNNSCRSGDGTTEVEPGSASTIMGYAGICATNIQNNSDDYFAYVNIRDIVTSINFGNASSCPDLIVSGNTGPTADAGADYNIPISTPFVLEGVGTDADDAGLTFCWEQNDPESPNSNNAPAATRTNGPMFRSFSPVAEPYRYMPNLNDIIDNVSPTWEVLPSVGRDMEFSFIVRDNNSTSGCTASDLMSVTTVSGAGPFLVTVPDVTGIQWGTGTIETVTWNVANTDTAPISCENVNILLSTDGGLTYPFTLASNVPNDGSHDITVPDEVTLTARIRVQCSDNIFFDISNNDFEIFSAAADFNVVANPSTVNVCVPDVATTTINVVASNGFSNNVDLTATGVPANSSATFSPTTVAGGDGSSTLTLTSAGVTPGTYTITIEGTDIASVLRTTTITFEVLGGAPSIVDLLSPSMGATGVNLTAPLSWNVAANALSYDLEVATDINFVNIVYTESGIASTSTTTSTLTTNTQYFWRVRSINPCGIAIWSDVWDFTTQDLVPCASYTTGPFTDFNPVPSSCFSDCGSLTQGFQVYQNEAYILYGLTEGEEYTFSFCDGYDAAVWQAQITVAEFDILSNTVIANSEFATILDCSLTFTVPSSGHYVIAISNPADCGGATVGTDNGIPSLSCSGLATCCGSIYMDESGPVADYANSQTSTYTICPDNAGQMVEVVFSQFLVEDNANGGCWDMLSIYNGNSTAAPLIGEYCNAPGGVGSPGTVTSSDLTGCLTFEFESDNTVAEAGWIAEVNCLSPLPVELLNFEAQKKGLTALLNWETASEQFNRGFYIEHSVDGRTFKQIGWVDGSGTTSALEKYQYTHDKPTTGVNYYRLVHENMDGSSKYSDIRTVLFDTKFTTVLFPNPNRQGQETSLQLFAQHQQDINITIYDTAGKQVAILQPSLEEGVNTIALSAALLSNGVYIVSIRHDEGMENIKLSIID